MISICVRLTSLSLEEVEKYCHGRCTWWGPGDQIGGVKSMLLKCGQSCARRRDSASVRTHRKRHAGRAFEKLILSRESLLSFSFPHVNWGYISGWKRKKANKKRQPPRLLCPYQSGGEPRGFVLFYLVVASSLLCASILCWENVYPYRPRGQQGPAPCLRLPSGSRAAGQTNGEHAFVWSSFSILSPASLPCLAFL